MINNKTEKKRDKNFEKSYNKIKGIEKRTWVKFKLQ